MDDRARDRGALHLTAGDLRGIGFRFFENADRRERGPHAIVHFALIAPLQDQRQTDVLGDRHRGQQIEELKDRADAIAAQRGQRIVRKIGRRPSVDFDRPGARQIDTAHEVEQRALPAAAGPDERDQFARAHG